MDNTIETRNSDRNYAFSTDTLLMPVKVGHDALMKELERNIAIVEDGNDFISYKDTLVFDTLFGSIYDKLELMFGYSDFIDEAIRTAKDIIERFENLETDDDYFPNYWIERLSKLIEKK